MTTIRHLLVQLTQEFVQRVPNFGNYLNLFKVRNRIIALGLVCLALTACVATPTASAGGRDAVRRDVEGYAIASCLTSQKEAYLVDQGDAWASSIIQRSHGNLEYFTALSDVVKKAVATGVMKVIILGPKNVKTLPVAFCAEIIDTPSVRLAIENTIKKLKPEYQN